MLHTVNQSPFDHNALESCLKFAGDGASLLLIEDGVYAAAAGTAVSQRVQDAAKRLTIYALEADVAARGLRGRVMEGIRLVDYGGFVDLVAEHNAVQSWN